MTFVPIAVQGLRKVYGEFAAVAGVDFEVAQGEIFGLLGPNGAGKTTTLECLEGLRQPTAGSLRVMGIDPQREPGKLAQAIGVQLQTSGLHPSMKVDEAMNFFCAYHRIKPRQDLLERMGLSEKRRTAYSDLSIGQKRRLNLALAVAHKPPVVILDEPTAGLDVSSRVELHAMMNELRQGGTTILLATHDMAEAEKMAGSVAIMLRGEIVARGTPIELTATGSGLTKVSVNSEGSVLHAAQADFPGVQQRLVKDDYAIFFSSDPGATVSALIAYLNEQGDTLIDLRVERPSLEERFLEITKI